MEDSYRPSKWDDYIGQEAVKERLRIHIDGAVERMEPLDHVLLMGPPGCGKTTLARLIASQLFEEFVDFICPINEKLLVRTLRSHSGVLFLDEIHRFSKAQQETLLPLIEDNYFQLSNGRRVETEYITIVGATTEPEKLIDPLIDRFHIKPMFHDYTDEEMGLIVKSMAERFGIDLDTESAERLGRATGGIPRKARELVSMARDLDTTNASLILEKCRLTEDGLTEQHVRYVQVLMDMGQPTGLDVMSHHIRLPRATLVDLERLLLKRGLIEYTKGGRDMTSAGYKQFNRNGY